MRILLVRFLQLSVLLGFSAAGQTQVGQRQLLCARVPAVVAGLQPIGVLPDSTRLNLALVLPLRNQAALASLLKDLYNPDSPNYRHYLSASEFADRFGPTRQDYDKLAAFAQAHHLEVRRTHSNRTLLDVSGTAADIRGAFGVKFKVYPHPTEKRNFYAPDGDPSIDAGVPMLAIKGLDDFVLPLPGGRARPLGGAGTSGAYLGNDFRTAYLPGVSLTGSGQQVALVEFDGYYPSDISKYQQLTGLPAITLTNVLVDGYPGLPDTDAEKIGEVSLDIEMVNAMAPGVSRIIVYEEEYFFPTDDILNSIATDDLASQISSSWIYEIDAASDQILQQFAAQGQSFFSASGDGGAYPPGQITEPMDSAYLTAVGGTALSTNSSGGWLSETVWSDLARGIQRASGGGYTTNYSIPNWQTNVSMTANGGSPAYRNIPDVAGVAANVLVIYNNGQTGVFDGTSCAAPLWAGFAALVNQQAAKYGNAIGFLNPALYAIGTAAGYATNFHDVTVGNNTNAISPTAYVAVAGYDLCTGWGTPNGSNLINALAPPDTLVMLPIPGFNARGLGGGPFDVTAGSYLLTNIGSASLGWSLESDAVWLSASPASGTLGPGATASVTVSLNADASNLVVGDYSAHMTLTNLSNGLLHHRAFTLQISDPLAPSPASGIEFGGPPSGPFNAAAQTCALTNAGQISVIWGVATNPPWLSVSPPSGVLEPSGAVQITCSLNSAATNLSPGAYSAEIVFTNRTFGAVESVPVLFLVGQLVQNGGFETGGFTGWTLTGNPEQTIIASGDPTIVHSGTYGVSLEEAGDMAYLSQEIPTVPGVSYSVSLWLDSPDGLTPNEFSVSWGAEMLCDYTNLPAIDWTNLQFIVLATNTNTLLAIGSRDNPSYLGLDDVRVTVAPPTLGGITPSGGPVSGGTTVTITGSGFQSLAAISFGSVPASSVAFDGTTKLMAVTPASSSVGPVNIAITNADGQTAVLSNSFVFVGTPTITWTNLAALSYGNALGAGHLNASASVPGAFSYNPFAGTILDAGSNLLSVVFTPNDSVDYYSVTDYVGLVVSPAPLSVTASNFTRPYGLANPVFTGFIAGLQNGDNITASYSCSATSDSIAGRYSIIPNLSDPGGLLPNYQVSIFDGTLTVLPPVPPVFQAAALSAGMVSITWTTTTGAAYQVQYNSDLTDTNWTNLGSLITATNPVADVTDSLTNVQRFYRVIQVPQ
jgi:hypothetical protein